MKEFNKQSKFMGILGIVFNLLIAIPKIFYGKIFFSLSLFADGINNLLDALSAVIVYLGIEISKKPKDLDHPYGHAKAEYITGFIVSMITFYTGIKFLEETAKRIFDDNKVLEVNYYWIYFLIFSMLIKFVLFLLNRTMFKKYNSSLFKALSNDSLQDILISSAVLVSLTIFREKNSLDIAIAFAIGMIIFKNAYFTLRDAIYPLIGNVPDKRDIDILKKELLKIDFVRGVHNLIVDRKSSTECFSCVDVVVDSHLTIREIHDRLEIVRFMLKNKYNMEVNMHIEPFLDDDKIIKIKEEVKKVRGVYDVYDIILGDENLISYSIKRKCLYRRDDIEKRVENVIKREVDKKWNIDVHIALEEE